MNFKSLIAWSLILFVIFGCTQDSPDDLVNDTPIVGLVKYNQNVKSIMDNNCISCHGTVPTNGASMSLVTFQQVKNSILNEGLLNRISLNNGDGLLMPQGGPRLPQATIDIVSKWELDGLLE